MRLTAIALVSALFSPTHILANPTDEDVASARLRYIDGDYLSSLPILKNAAEAGNGTALNILGAAYEDGRGVQQDTQKAIELFQQAAQAGEVRGYYNLGTLFANEDEGALVDIARATLEFQKAADQGYPPAMTALGRLLEYAEPPKLEAAADWYEKGHEAGDVVATTNLAHSYVKGRGRNVNWIKARVLYTEAAARGYGRAFNDLGVMHEEGYGVHSDQLTAYSFYHQGVISGDAKSGVNIAELIIRARFPFSSKHAALGFCIWALERVEDRERDEFESDCAAVRNEVEPDDAMNERARAFALRLSKSN